MRRAPILILVIVGLLAFPAAAAANDQAIYEDLVIQSIFVLGPVSQLEKTKTPAAATTMVKRIITAATTAQHKIAGEHASTPAGAKCKTRGAAIFAGYVASGKTIEAGIQNGSSAEILKGLHAMQATGVKLIAAEKACESLK
jgi:hypothetical protein